MARLTTGLPAYGFLDDLPDIVFSEITTTASVSVKLNGTALLTNVKMVPDAKKTITIYAKQMIRNIVSLTKPNSCALELPQLTVQIAIAGEELLSTSGYVIPGRTNGLGIITQEWFSENLLTWQPQITETTRTQPQWLALIPVPTFVQYEIQSTLYTRDGRIFTQSFFNIPSGPNFQQFRADFTYLWKSHCIANDLDPYGYDVFGKGYKMPLSSVATAEADAVPEKAIQPLYRINRSPNATSYVPNVTTMYVLDSKTHWEASTPSCWKVNKHTCPRATFQPSKPTRRKRNSSTTTPLYGKPTLAG